jgi:hypothetical protein
MTLIAAHASISNPFERLSEIAFGLIMTVSFTGALRGRRREIWNRTIAWPETSQTITAECLSRVPGRWCRSICDTAQRCLQKS